MCMHEKEPQESPEHTSENVKSQNFLGVCPQTPSHYRYFGAPFFVFSLSPQILSAALTQVLDIMGLGLDILGTTHQNVVNNVNPKVFIMLG